MRARSWNIMMRWVALGMALLVLSSYLPPGSPSSAIPSAAQLSDVALLAPVAAGQKLTITHGYNDIVAKCEAGKPPDHCGNQRYGLDFGLSNPSDLRVLAPLPGTVHRIVDECVLLRTLDNLNLNICHLAESDVIVKEGDTIKRGQVLGNRVANKQWIHLSLDDRFRDDKNKPPVPFNGVHTIEGKSFDPPADASKEHVHEGESIISTNVPNSATNVPGRPSISSATVLVMDVSASMDVNDVKSGLRNIDAAKKAATSVVDMIETENQSQNVGHRVALVWFSTGASVAAAMTSDTGSVKQAIDTLAPMESTNIGEGLRLANSELAAATEGTKVIILMSDGATNVGLSREEILAGPVKEAADQGICIYTVGFGDPNGSDVNYRLDEDFLQRIASASKCGGYYNALNAYELEKVYVKLRHVSMGTVVGDFSGQLSQNETVVAGKVTVPPNQGQLYVTLSWPGSALDLLLTDPAGRKVTANYPGVSISTLENLIYMIVENPVAGDWLVNVFGREVPEGTTDYNAVLSVRERVTQPADYSGLIMISVTLIVGVLAAVLITQASSSKAGVFLVQGSGPARFVPIRGASFGIGRDPRGNMVLADGKVSRNHARIIRDPSGYAIQDLRSTNGTFVNGQRISQQRLRSGDQIRVGDTKMVFRG
jgi:Mg-chelatase subunit ChlD/biotin carboxyl carrier protein